MSSATGRKSTDAGSLLTGRRRIPHGDAANAANPVNAQHLPDCSTADSPAPQALPTSFLPTLPRQATTDVFPSQPASLTFCSIKNRHPFPNDDFSTSILFSTDLPTIILSADKERKTLFSFTFPIKYNDHRKTANCNQDPGNYIGGITSLHNIYYFLDMVRYIRFRWCWFR